MCDSKGNSGCYGFDNAAPQAAAKLDADDRTVFDQLWPKPNC